MAPVGAVDRDAAQRTTLLTTSWRPDTAEYREEGATLKSTSQQVPKDPALLKINEERIYIENIQIFMLHEMEE